MEITFIIILSYVAHVFLCRWFLKMAYRFNKNEIVKEHIPICFYPLVGLIGSVIIFVSEREELGENKLMKSNWFNGKNW